ncbi:hypothetical protein JXA84_01420 [candidate division WOR-3 bacterium]|nr:hypothetical protein [candidate division WOR-3 bacterium]
MKHAVLSFLILVFTASFSSAEVVEYPELGVSFYLFDNWKAEYAGEDLWVWTSDEILFILFSPTTKETFVEDFDDMILDLEASIGEIDLDEPEEETLNGMRALYGEGSVSGGEILVAYFIFELCDEKGLIMLGFADEEEIELHEDEVEEFIESITPL